jgi:N-acetylmuramoyl-L-alanine amidase
VRSPEQTHTVRQGECLVSIAKRYGFEDPNEIYQDVKNVDLRRLRPNPNLLYPGDKVVIPAHDLKSFTLPTGQRHKLVVIVPKRKVRVRVLGADRQPLKNLPFKLDTPDRVYEGQSDGDGVVEKMIPAEVEAVTLHLGDVTLPLLLGHLNPRENTDDDGTSALQARLKNLGYQPGRIDGCLGPRTRAALRRFQADQDLDVTGEPDDATLEALLDGYGC